MMALSTCTFLFALLFTSTDAQDDHGQCQGGSDCVCLFNDGWSVNLAPIGNTKFGPAKGGDYYYTYWPCAVNPFDEGSCSVSGSVIQATEGTTDCYSCGDSTQSVFAYDGDGTLYIAYKGGTDDRASKVRLICSQSSTDDFQFKEEELEKEYAFELTSKYACPISPGDDPSFRSSISISLSPGTILCIIAINVVVVYLVVGVLVMKFYKRAEGREVIPNYALWAAIPGLIKDGGIFFISLFPCGKNLSVTNTETAKYDNL